MHLMSKIVAVKLKTLKKVQFCFSEFTPIKFIGVNSEQKKSGIIEL